MAKHMINDLVKPKKMVYIAIDGPAPKCKIVTQRDRRYKSIIEKQILREIQHKYLGKQLPPGWDKASITPGTKFMAKLDEALHNAITNEQINCPQVIFNNSAQASEGEHKIIQHLSKLSHSPEESICVYSNDGDMAFLTLQFPDKNILTMIDSNFLPANIKKECESDYVYFDNNTFHSVLIKDMFSSSQPSQQDNSNNSNNSQQDNSNNTNQHNLTTTRQRPFKKRKTQQSTLNPDDYDKNRILIDFMFLLFLGGNDFVRPIPFAKIRTTGVYQMFLKVYMFSLRKTNSTTEYLIGTKDDPHELNQKFFSGIMYGLALQEPRRMLYYNQQLQQTLKKESQWGPFDNWQEEWLQFQHTPYNSPSHPEHEIVKDKLLDFKYADIEAHEEWKGQYYKANFGLNMNNTQEYNSERTKICRIYIKSLLFTLGYYLTGSPPSWKWNYPHDVAPWPSDISFYLRRANIRKLNHFEKHEPYTSQQQLLLTVPITSKVFPDEYRGLHRLLPRIKRDLDRVNGGKYIYSEPLLGTFNEIRLLKQASNIKLKPCTIKRNQIVTKPMIYNKH